MNKKEKLNVISNIRKEERDKNINQFLSNFNNQGKADIIKEKLKRFIIRIIREKYKKKEVIEELFKDNKNKFYAELFAYLSDEVKLAMDEYVGIKRDSLHDDIISSYDDSRSESLKHAARVSKEPEEKRLFRLSKEYEIMGNMDKSYYYFKARLTINPSKESWTIFAQLAKKMGIKI